MAAYHLWHWQEHGIFHAIEQQYLKSFIFAIYLVSTGYSVSQSTENLSYLLLRIVTTLISDKIHLSALHPLIQIPSVSWRLTLST